MSIKQFVSSISGAFALGIAVPAVAFAATSTIIVNATNTHGWTFNQDTTTATPYTFTGSAASTGLGSLYVKPIGTHASDKFIAIKPLNTSTGTVSQVAYDFKIAGNGTASSANQFYLNAYTTLPGSPSSTYYDCRFDYVPTAGSTTSFTTASFAATATPTNVAARGSATCPPTLSDMPLGSTLKFIALNVGDSSDSDAGLAGYLDNVVVTSGENAVAYDFEPVVLTDKEDCKKDGWKKSQAPVFKNQGECVSSFASEHGQEMANKPSF